MLSCGHELWSRCPPVGTRDPEGWRAWEGGDRKIHSGKSMQNLDSSAPGLPANCRWGAPEQPHTARPGAGTGRSLRSRRRAGAVAQASSSSLYCWYTDRRACSASTVTRSWPILPPPARASNTREKRAERCSCHSSEFYLGRAAHAVVKKMRALL